MCCDVAVLKNIDKCDIVANIDVEPIEAGPTLAAEETELSELSALIPLTHPSGESSDECSSCSDDNDVGNFRPINDDSESGDSPRTSKASKTPKVVQQWNESFVWGRSYATFIGKGFLPSLLAEQLEGRQLIEQLFLLRDQIKKSIKYELGRVTAKRPPSNSGHNEPVTYASNIWNRGYANCAGHCVVVAAALRKLDVPFCIVTLRSPQPGRVKHAIMEVGFPHDADIKAINSYAHQLWTKHYGKKKYQRKDKETNEKTTVHLFQGLKFTHSAANSPKGLGHWLWWDPQCKVGKYDTLIRKGYIIQHQDKHFSFAMPPQVKTWSDINVELKRYPSNHEEEEEADNLFRDSEPLKENSTSN